MTLGERVLIWRRRRNLTQQGLADAVGVAKNTISRLEQGGITDLRGQAIAKLAQVLGVSTDYLLGLDEPEQAASHGSESSEHPTQGKSQAKVKARAGGGRK
jgi:transcriptional regulator with XRE-family HTH domain